MCSLALAACGSSTTRTVTKSVTATGAGSSANTTPATSTGGASATGAVSTAATSTTAAPAYFQGAVANAQQRPSSLQLTADGTLIVDSVQWTSWGGPTATGTGTADYHGCNPNCASAPSHSAVVAIRLSDVRVCSGRRYYASVTLKMSSGRLLDPGYVQRAWSPC